MIMNISKTFENISCESRFRSCNILIFQSYVLPKLYLIQLFVLWLTHFQNLFHEVHLSIKYESIEEVLHLQDYLFAVL